MDTVAVTAASATPAIAEGARVRTGIGLDGLNGRDGRNGLDGRNGALAPATGPVESFAVWTGTLQGRVLAPLSRTGWRYWAWLGFLVAVLGWALYAYSVQWQRGLVVTGMRDRMSWGIYIISFVFFIGISHAGTLLSAILRVVKARWQLSITRMAEFITVVALMVGALFPLIDLGRPDRALNVFLFGRWQSPLLWDVLAICTYLTGSTLYLYLPLVPDFALCRDRLGPTAPRWKRLFFETAALGWRGTPAQQEALERAMTIMMLVIIPVAVSVHTVISWIFAMSLREPFNSTIFGAYFVAGAIFSGIAAIILLMAVLRRVLRLEAYITQKQFVSLGYLLAGFTLIMLYMNLSEYITTGYKMSGATAVHFQQLMVGRFAGLFWFYIVGGLIVPGLLMLYPRTRTIRGVVAAALLALAAMWVERYLIVVGGFSVPLMPYEPQAYLPTWIEWSILAGAFALFALIISVFVKLFPVVSIWEVTHDRAHELAHATVVVELDGLDAVDGLDGLDGVGGVNGTNGRHGHQAGGQNGRHDGRHNGLPALEPVARVGGTTAVALCVVAGLAAAVLGAGPAGTAHAQTGALQPTTISLDTPPAAALGQVVTLQARLQTASGRPLTGETVSFTTTASFLNVAGKPVIAQAATDGQGVATATWRVTRSGAVTLGAQFDGDASFARATTTAPWTVAGDESPTLYAPQAGVRIPGLNEAPLGQTTPLSALWPRLSSWPIAVALLVVWLLYAAVVRLMLKVARLEPAAVPGVLGTPDGMGTAAVDRA